MDAPRFDLLFKPRQYTPNPEGTQNFIGNIAALADPSGTLSRKQAELVAKSAAQFKADDLKGQFQETALKLIEKNLEDEMNMYKQNRGFNRLSLSGSQLLEKQRKDKALIANIGTLKQINDDYLQTEDKVGKYVIEGVLSPEDYTAYANELKSMMNAAGGDPAKIPYPSAVLNNYLMKNTTDKWIKELDLAMKFPMEAASKRPTTVPRDGKYFNEVNYDPLNDVLPLIDIIPGARRGLVAMFGDNKNAMEQWLKDRYDISSSQLAPGQMSNTNNITVNSGTGNDKASKSTIPFRKPLPAENQYMRTNLKGEQGQNKIMIDEIMDLNIHGSVVPWSGELKIGGPGQIQNVPAKGDVIAILTDKSGGMYMRVMAEVGTDDVIQDMPITTDMIRKLANAGIDVTEIRRKFGLLKSGDKNKIKKGTVIDLTDL